MSRPAADTDRICPACGRRDWRPRRSDEARSLAVAARLNPDACGRCLLATLAEIGRRALLARSAAP